MFAKKLMVLILSFVAFSSYALNRAEIGWQKVEQGALLVDVRTPSEFNSQHIDKAVNYPLNTINVAFKDIDKNQPIVVYCRSGNRSGQAEHYLTQIGFTNVHNAGGLKELLDTK